MAAKKAKAKGRTRRKPRAGGDGGASAESDPRLRIAITGVNNPIMAGLCALLDKDPSVASMLLIDVIRPAQDYERGHFEQVDLTLPDAERTLRELFIREGVRIVIHGAFLANPARDPSWAHELEAVGSHHVLGACAAAGVEHILLRSTSMVYGAHFDNPAFCAEDHPIRGNRASRWVRDKIEADLQFQRFGEENPGTVVTVARLATVLAPSVTHYLARYLSRPVVPVIAGFDPLMQFLDLSDAAETLAAMVRARIPGVYNIAPDGVLPLSTILSIGRRVALPVPRSMMFATARMLWRSQLTHVPPRFLTYFQFSWNTDGARCRKTFGVAPRRSSRDVVEAFYRGTDAHRAES